MTTLFLMFLPILLLWFHFKQQVRTALTMLYQQLAGVACAGTHFSLLPTVAGIANATADKDDTGESPKDPGPTQPIKQS